jgi:hypothetical protein
MIDDDDAAGRLRVAGHGDYYLKEATLKLNDTPTPDIPYAIFHQPHCHVVPSPA